MLPYIRKTIVSCFTLLNIAYPLTRVKDFVFVTCNETQNSFNKHFPEKRGFLVQAPPRNDSAKEESLSWWSRLDGIKICHCLSFCGQGVCKMKKLMTLYHLYLTHNAEYYLYIELYEWFISCLSIIKGTLFDRFKLLAFNTNYYMSRIALLPQSSNRIINSYTLFFYG